MKEPKSEGGKIAAVEQDDFGGKNDPPPDDTLSDVLEDTLTDADDTEQLQKLVDAASTDEDSIKENASSDSDAIEQAETTDDTKALQPQADPDHEDYEPIENADDYDSAPDTAEDELPPEKGRGPIPIPAQTIDIVAPFGDNQLSVIMYDEDDRVRRVARTAQGTTLRFVLNENERLFISVADPTQHDKFLAMRDEDAAARG